MAIGVKGGYWSCPDGDIVFCNKCYFIPKNICPEHDNFYEELGEDMLRLSKQNELSMNCSLCRNTRPVWKCPKCTYLICGECAVRPLYCPRHKRKDVVIMYKDKLIICAL